MDLDFLFRDPGIGDAENLDDYLFQIESPRLSEKRRSEDISESKDAPSAETSALMVHDGFGFGYISVS